MVAACGVAAGSKISNMDAAQIARLSDAEVCHPLATGQVVEQEREKRGLADCDPAHFECRKLGYKLGTAEYLQCRQMIAQQEMAAAAYRQKIISDGVAGWQRAYQPTPSTTTHTTCSPAGNGVDVDCTSSTQ
jgi:hypothetical protein